DNQGALYGTTTAGGGSGCHGGCGTVFKLTPPAKGQNAWKEAVLHSFCAQSNYSDGSNPGGSVIFANHGALYGTTTDGGGSGCPGLFSIGCGTVFKLTPPAKGETKWLETILYRFNGGSDGAGPTAGLIADKEGAVYGPTAEGGINACVPDRGCG